MDLNIVEVKDRPRVVVSLLRESGAVVACEAIQAVADVSGDGEAFRIISSLPALAIADIVREFDYTKPSIVGDLLTPLQLRKVVQRLPHVGGNVQETLCAVILQREEKYRGAFFRELGKSELTLMALAVAFDSEVLLRFAYTNMFGEFDEEEVTENEVKKGEWEELLFSLKSCSPRTFRRVVSMVEQAKDAVPRRNLALELERECRKVFGKMPSASDDPYASFL